MPSADLLSALPRRTGERRRRATLWLLAVAAAIGTALLLQPRAFERFRSRLLESAGVFAGATTGAQGNDVAHPASRLAGRADLPGSLGDEASTVTRVESTRRPSSAEADVVAVSDIPQLRTRPLVEWLSDIAASARRGLVIAPDVDGEATAAFEPESRWEERLDVLARVHGFHYTVDERLIEVWLRPRSHEPLEPDEPPGAMLPAERGSIERADGGGPLATAPRAGLPDSLAGVALAAAQPAEPPRATTVARPQHARAADLVAALGKAARAVDVQVAADPGSNAVVVAGPEAAVDEMATLLTLLDVPRRRFVLEAEIVELSRTAREELGVQWSIDGTVSPFVDFPASDAPGESAGIIVATDGAHALRARINALEADGLVRVISRPRVVVLEGRPASIESVRILRVRFPDRAAVVGEIEDAENLGSGERAVEEIPVGVVLRVEPSMQGDGRIVLRIRAKSSTLGPPQPPDGIPEELSRMVDAEVAVADGETAVLGGLLRENENHSGTGVPVLRSLPLLGALFGRRKHERDGEELVVLVTPRLLR